MADENQKVKENPSEPAAAKNAVGANLSNLSPARGSHHRRKMVGRGVGSGHGRHSTRGMKGQRSRRGDSKMIGFEGGQMPLLRRIPKRGFTPPFPKKYSVLNVGDLEGAPADIKEINPALLKEKGVIKKNWPVKILGDGELKRALKISAHAFSAKAIEKIKAAGGEFLLLK